MIKRWFQELKCKLDFHDWGAHAMISVRPKAGLRPPPFFRHFCKRCSVPSEWMNLAQHRRVLRKIASSRS